MSKLNVLDWVALILIIVGGLNWGLVAIGFNLVGYIFASIPVLQTIVYALVGLSAIYVIFILKKIKS